MDDLCVELQKLRDECGLNNVALARRAAMDRPTVVHILSGHRRPTAENLETLLHALEATPTQRRRLLELYEEEKTDPATRRQREAVKGLIQRVSRMHEENQEQHIVLVENPKLQQRLEMETAIFNGHMEIVAALQQLILRYCKNPSGPLMIPPGLREEWLDLLPEILARAAGKGEIWHICTFIKRTAGRDETIHNLNNLAYAIPLACLTGWQYKTHFCYSISGEPLPAALFSSYILFPDSIFVIQRNGARAWMSHTPEIVEAARQAFEEDFNGAHSYLDVEIQDHDGAEAIMMNNSALDQQCRPTWYLCWNPQLIGLLDKKEFLANMTVPPEAQAMAELIWRRVDEIAAVPATTYCLAEGVQDFVATGLVADIPASVYRPADLRQRCLLLDRLIEASKGEHAPHYLLSGKGLMPPRGFTLAVVEGVGVKICQLFANDAQSGLCRTYFCSEPSTTEAFCDYLKNLKNTGDVYSREESIAILQQMRKICAMGGGKGPQNMCY